MKDWQDKVRRDLLPFANPGTALACVETDQSLEVSWKSRNSNLIAHFSLDQSHNIEVIFNNVRISYKSFLASTEISDMLGIAGMISQLNKNAIYVETKASSPDVTEWDQPATKLINTIVHNISPGITNVVFVNADAGAGKTEALKHLVRKQAEKYLIGQTDFLYLYVNAQGRALARLEEALATEIQDLRAANLTYHVVPSLTRNGILVPLIDGFDELLGVLGYEDSFSSLRRFLNELNGEGCVIASARSTYFQQEFLSRASKATSGLKGINITQVDILPWSNTEFSDFVEKRYYLSSTTKQDFDSFKEEMTEAFSSDANKTLRSKPFFVAAAANLILEGIKLSDKEIIDQLVQGYIERERKDKLLDRSGRSLLTGQQIKEFLQSISEEMWASETRSLDRDTIKILAELVFRFDKVDLEAARVLQERATTMAFFTTSSHRDRIEFEHQLFFSYFLGDTIAAAFEKDMLFVYNLFVRASLPESSSSFASRILAAKSYTASEVVNKCSMITTKGSLKPPHLKENSGSVVAEFLKVLSEQNIITSFSGLTFQDITFAGTKFPNISISESLFINVDFKRADATELALINCTATHVYMEDLLIDPLYTKLDISGIAPGTDIYGLRIRLDGNLKQIFRLNKIIEALESCKFPSIKPEEHFPVEEDMLILIEKLLRKFDRSNVFWPTDDVNKQITSDSKWIRLHELLVLTGIVIKERTIAQKGPPKYYLRSMYSSEQIMSGQFYGVNSPSPVRNFWLALKENRST